MQERSPSTHRLSLLLSLPTMGLKTALAIAACALVVALALGAPLDDNAVSKGKGKGHDEALLRSVRMLFERVAASQQIEDVPYNGGKGGFPPMQWARHKGLFPSEIRVNFHGDPVSALFRNIFSVPDNNAHLTMVVADMLLQARELVDDADEDAPFNEDQLQLAIDALLEHRDKNYRSHAPIYSFWDQKKIEKDELAKKKDAPKYTAWPENLAEPLKAGVSLADMVRRFANVTHTTSHVEKALEYLEIPSAFLRGVLVPADADDTAMALVLGARLACHKNDFPKAAREWFKENEHVELAAKAMAKHAYRPFSKDVDENTIDPRTYYWLRKFVDAEAEKHGDAHVGHTDDDDDGGDGSWGKKKKDKGRKELAILSTWLQHASDAKDLHEVGYTMPFMVNNIDLAVASNALYGLTAAVVAEEEGQKRKEYGMDEDEVLFELHVGRRDPEGLLEAVEHVASEVAEEAEEAAEAALAAVKRLLHQMDGADDGGEVGDRRKHDDVDKKKGKKKDKGKGPKWFDDDLRGAYEGTARVLAWAIESDQVETRPDLTLPYYPSLFSFYYFAGRLAHALGGDARLADVIESFETLEDAQEAIVGAMRNYGTAQILKRCKGLAPPKPPCACDTDDAEGGCEPVDDFSRLAEVDDRLSKCAYFEEFLGEGDVLGNTTWPKHEDRLFSTSMAINALIDTWTETKLRRQYDAAPNGDFARGGKGKTTPHRVDRMWLKDTPKEVIDAVESSLFFLAHAATAHVKSIYNSRSNAFFSASMRSADHLPHWFPATDRSYANGTELTCSDDPGMRDDVFNGVSGHVDPDEYAKMLQDGCFGRPVPESYGGANCESCVFPFWSSAPLTDAAAALALAKWAALERGHR